jgi:hypothetical protein
VTLLEFDVERRADHLGDYSVCGRGGHALYLFSRIGRRQLG